MSKTLQKKLYCRKAYNTLYDYVLYIATLNLSTYMYINVHLGFGTSSGQNAASFSGKLLYCCYGPGLK